MGGTDIAGITVYAEKAIYLHAYSYTYTIHTSTIHELGHFYDWLTWYKSDYNDWGDVFNVEAQNIVSSSGTPTEHLKINRAEFFAGIFDNAVRGDTADYYNCPQSRAIMDNLLSTQYVDSLYQ